MDLLKPLIGRKVTVYTVLGGGTERQEVGVLEAAQDGWLQIRKGEDLMFYSTSSIRLVKPFEPL
ncbi:MAG: hypothetical protein SFX74_04080 [Fimbriimonadaceae bacterium]|nr:hypothetical protein [Fimbriimonadaceae bacterium]